ncbi:MAG: SpoIIE family protein phosphatase [Planctomycetaceae bacterium]|nr:SpoIIE family protein phosphatase [Planctomycetaceae bacterium]
MTKPIPTYLKLHVEESLTARVPVPEIPGLAAALDAFRDITGWRLSYTDTASVPASVAWTMPIGVPEEEEGRLELCPDPAGVASALALDKTQPLAAAIGTLVTEICRAQSVVRHREAELAAGIPVTLRPAEQQQLALRLEAVLRGGAEAIGCQAAALYLLDDATAHLKLRAAWRLPKNRFLDAPRPLRGAVADLEALVGHAVALEDTALLPHWKVPENYPAALCVPVASSSTPLGTLWFFAQATREFTPEQTHLAEIVAGRLVSDLEREVLVREGVRNRQTDQARQLLTQWQNEQRPNVPPLVDGWQVAGCLSGDDPLNGLVYDWCVLPDGRIAVALGQADGLPVEASLTATALHVALKSHATYPHEARQMLDRLNEALWTCSTGNRFASLVYALLDPETGEMEYAMAGETHALVVGPHTCTSLSASEMRLGADPDAHFRQQLGRLDPGDSLLLFTCGDLTSIDPEAVETDEGRAVAALVAWPRATAEEQVRAVLGELAAESQPDRAVVVARRIS